MSERPDVTRIREAYDAFARGVMAALAEYFTADVVNHVAGQHQLAGDFKGHEEVFGHFGKLAELAGGTMKMDVHDVLGSDDHAVGLISYNARREGRVIDMNEVHVFHMRDGKVAEMWAIEQDQERAKEFWG